MREKILVPKTYFQRTFFKLSKNLILQLQYCLHFAKRIETTQNKLERSILNIKLQDKIRTKTIKNKLKNHLNLTDLEKINKWNWGVGRTGDNRWTYRTTFWFLTHKKRKKGKQKAR